MVRMSSVWALSFYSANSHPPLRYGHAPRMVASAVCEGGRGPGAGLLTSRSEANLCMLQPNLARGLSMHRFLLSHVQNVAAHNDSCPKARAGARLLHDSALSSKKACKPAIGSCIQCTRGLKRSTCASSEVVLTRSQSFALSPNFYEQNNSTRCHEMRADVDWSSGVEEDAWLSLSRSRGCRRYHSIDNLARQTRSTIERSIASLDETNASLCSSKYSEQRERRHWR